MGPRLPLTGVVFTGPSVPGLFQDVLWPRLSINPLSFSKWWASLRAFRGVLHTCEWWDRGPWL